MDDEDGIHSTLVSRRLKSLTVSIQRRFGFCFVNNTPPTPKATEDLLNRIGPIRNTHYGMIMLTTQNTEY